MLVVTSYLYIFRSVGNFFSPTENKDYKILQLFQFKQLFIFIVWRVTHFSPVVFIAMC